MEQEYTDLGPDSTLFEMGHLGASLATSPSVFLHLYNEIMTLALWQCLWEKAGPDLSLGSAIY